MMLRRQQLNLRSASTILGCGEKHTYDRYEEERLSIARSSIQTIHMKCKKRVTAIHIAMSSSVNLRISQQFLRFQYLARCQHNLQANGSLRRVLDRSRKESIYSRATKSTIFLSNFLITDLSSSGV